MKPKPSRRILKRFDIPIYNAVFHVFIGDNIAKERSKPKWVKIFGSSPADFDYNGLASSEGHNFAIFLERTPMSINIIAHEVFHVTHRMLEWVGANFDKGHHETACLLHGYLFDLTAKVCGIKL